MRLRRLFSSLILLLTLAMLGLISFLKPVPTFAAGSQSEANAQKVHLNHFSSFWRHEPAIGAFPAMEANAIQRANIPTQAGVARNNDLVTGADVTGLVILPRATMAQATLQPSRHASLSVRFFSTDEEAPTYSFTPTVDASGAFHLTGISPGEYLVAVKQSHTLQSVHNVTVVTGSNSIDFGSLRAGDASDSNSVTSKDFSLLASSFEHCTHSTGYDARADFDEDGCVTLDDLSLLSMNYWEEGDLAPDDAENRVATVEVATIEQESGAGTVDLRLQHTPATVQIGQHFAIEVQVEAGDQAVDVVGVYLNFDSSLLKVVRIRSGDTLDTVLRSIFDNRAGTIGYEAGKLGESFPTGSFTLFTIQFKVIGNITESTLTFSHDLPRQSAAYRAGVNQLGTTQDGKMVVEEGEPVQPQLYLPLL